MPIKTLLFDFMGTCLDWHSTLTTALPLSIPAATRSALSLHWRQEYFQSNKQRQASGLPPENIDITHRRTLEAILSSTGEFSSCKAAFDADPESYDRCIAVWHAQSAWSDVRPALEKLKGMGYELVVHANGTTRLQIDLVKSARLEGLFDLLVSSEMLSVYKPAPEAYERCLKLLGRTVEEVGMVAAHVDDVRGAKAVGIKGVYVRRWSDDVLEDQSQVKKECDEWIDGMGGLVDAIRRLEEAV